MSGLSYEFVLNASLCRPAHCSQADVETRRNQIKYIDFAPSYAEPGYTNPARGILFGNWNYFAGVATDILERMGYECEWEDEWSTCSGCGKAIRTSADSYCWQPSYFDFDCELLCRECVDMEEYLENLEDDPNKALNDHVDPADYGYEKLEGDFENGFHPGQNADPKTIFAAWQEKGYTRLLFCIDDVGQFDIGFSIWRKIADTDEE